MIKNLIGALLCLCTAITLAAQEDTLMSVLSDEIFITASKFEEEKNDLSQSVQVIGKEELTKSTSRDVATLLQTVAGIHIVGVDQTPGSNQSIFMRGMNSNHFHILIDGQRITDPSTVNNTIDLSELSLVNVDRIEILRGSSSVTYGSGALGGVINIITQPSSNEGFGFSGDLGTTIIEQGGMDRSAGVRGIYSVQNFNISAGIFHRDVDGIDATLPSPASTVLNADNDDFTKTDYSVRAAYDDGQWGASLAYKRVSQLAEIDNGAFNDDDTGELDFDRNLFSYSLSKKWGYDWSAVIQGQASNLERVSTFLPSAIDDMGATDETTSINEFEGYNWSSEARVRYQQPSLQVDLGIGVVADSMTSRTTFTSPFFSFSADLSDTPTSLLDVYSFINVHKMISDRVGLRGGLRLSHNSQIDWNHSFSLNPYYSFSKSGMVYLNITQGFNLPSLFQLYSPDVDFTSGITLGNPVLQPEKLRSIELGLRKEADNVTLELNIFSNSVEDQIEFIYLWNPDKPVEELDFSDFRGNTYLNIGDYTTAGIEVKFDYHPSTKWNMGGNVTLFSGNSEITSEAEISNDHIGNNYIQLFSNGAFIEPRQGVSQDLLRRPQRINLYGAYQITENLKTSLFHRYIGSRNDASFNAALGPFGALSQTGMDAVNLFDFGLNYQMSESMGISLAIKNLLNTEYSEILGFRTLGRTYGVKFYYR